MLPIKDPGVTHVGKIAERSQAGSAAKITGSASLSSLTEEYVVFTPALLYSLLPLQGRDPLTEYVALTGSTPPFWLNLPNVVFAGLCNEFACWTARLGLIDKSSWPSLRQFFGRTVFTDAETGLVARVRWQPVTIADPIVIARATQLPTKGWPTVKLYAMALETNQYRAYVWDGKFAYDYKVLDDVALFAQAVQTGKEDPYNFVELEIEQKTGVIPELQRLAKLADNHYIQEQTAAAQERLRTKLAQDLADGTAVDGEVPDAGI